ncbi:MAG: hypothetical protein E6J61_19780 [Deltaproteobacteria bacterium]|nr:MAG: hypothetical protein E6J61_19780 [Deltaproteobacteria bacterium]
MATGGVLGDVAVLGQKLGEHPCQRLVVVDDEDVVAACIPLCLGAERQPQDERVGVAGKLSAVEQHAMTRDEKRHPEALARELRLFPAGLERARPLRDGKGPVGPGHAQLRARPLP